MSLWKQGLPISFWPNHLLQTFEHETLMLPSYQFSRVQKSYTGKTWLDTPLSDCFSQVGGLRVNFLTEHKNPSQYYTSVDGYNRQSDEPNDTTEKELFRLYAGDTSFDGCHHARSLDQMVKLLPEGVVEFQKWLDMIEKGDEFVTMTFGDGKTATAGAGQ